MADEAFVCNATATDFDTSGAARFSNKKYIQRSHNFIPRFGNPSDVSLLVSGTPEEGGDYLAGLVSASIWIFSLFLCWMVNLIVLKCLGSKNTGFFSGRRVRRPKAPSPPEEAVEVEVNLAESGSSEYLSETEANAFNEEEESASCKAESKKETGHHNGGKVKIHDGTSDVDKDEDYATALKAWEDDVAATERRLRRIRIAVLFSGCVIVVCAILMIVLGVASLSDSTYEVKAGLEEGERLCLEAVDLIDRFDARQEQNANATASYRDDVNDFCPNVRNKICESLSPVTNCNFEGLPSYLVNSLADLLENGRGYLYDELFNIRKDLVETADVFHDYQKYAGSFGWAFWISGAFAMLIAVLTLILMYGVVLAWQGKLHESRVSWIRSFVQNWFAVPIYAGCVVLSWVFSMVFVIGAGLMADFCVDSPDTRVSKFLYKKQDEFSSLVFDFAVFYVESCPADKVPLNFDQALENLFVILDAVISFGESLRENAVLESGQTLSELCGRDPRDFEAIGRALENSVCGTATYLRNVRDYFSCANFRPVYEKVVYGALCYEGTQGFAAITLTQLLIVFFTMVMLTLRVAFAEVKDEEDEETRRKCLAWCKKKTCCCCDGQSTEEEAGGGEGGVPNEDDDSSNNEES